MTVQFPKWRENSPTLTKGQPHPDQRTAPPRPKDSPTPTEGQPHPDQRTAPPRPKDSPTPTKGQPHPDPPQKGGRWDSREAKTRDE